MGRCLSCHMDKCWYCENCCHDEPKSNFVRVEPAPLTKEQKAEIDRTLSLASGVCPKHKRYQVKRKPTGGCEDCWWLWLDKKGYP